MFSFFKKKFPTVPVDFSRIKTDMHSHLLPGIDDGSPDVEVSLDLKKGLEDLGFEQFITTPHIMWDIYKNTPESIHDALVLLQQVPDQKNIRPAAEYYMDEHFDELLEKEEPLLTITGNKVLVEFSFISAPLDLKDKLFNLQIKGYQPILAHPERYTYFVLRKGMYDDFKDMGCLFQLNILSLCGYYGKLQQDLALYLVSKNYFDFVGTDLHHDRHLEILRTSKDLKSRLLPLLDSGRLQNSSLLL